MRQRCVDNQSKRLYNIASLLHLSHMLKTYFVKFYCIKKVFNKKKPSQFIRTAYIFKRNLVGYTNKPSMLK